MLLCWIFALAHWFRYHDALILIFLSYLGLFIGAGIGGYIALPNRQRPAARHLVMILLGGLLLITAFLSEHGNMQLEGFFFAVLSGGGAFVILHFAIAKLFGPLLFGRIWCGWACWYGMIFDLLPYPASHYHRNAKWGVLRYLHFALSLVLVLILLYGFGFHWAEGRAGMLWFALGVLSYYLIGISLALLLKDNRAFCKYLCPLAVPLKTTAAFSLLKISGVSTHCADCEACVESCPMNIRVRDYIMAGERVLSTECTLCLTCIHVCPHQSLKLSMALDRGGKEYLDYDPSPGNRDFRGEEAPR